jgi:hypothetical protein
MSLLLLFTSSGAIVSGTSSSGLGSGGGGPFGGSRRRRSVDFERMWRHMDAVNAHKEKERRAALERLDKSIEDAVNGVKEEAKEVSAPRPAAVIKTAGIISQQIAGALVGEGRSLNLPDLQQSVRQFEQQIRAAQQRFDAHNQRLAIEHELRGRQLAVEQQQARERELARLKALEEDDEEVLMLLM